jgi:hypothetical protein
MIEELNRNEPDDILVETISGPTTPCPVLHLTTLHPFGILDSIIGVIGETQVSLTKISATATEKV